MIINRDQLSLQLDRLIDTFGDKAFSDQRVALIWEIVDGLEYASVIKMVDQFISCSRHAPLPNDFSEAAKEYNRVKRRWALGEIQPKEIAQCWDCGDSGFIRLKRRETYEPWAKWWSGSAPCHCDRGRQLIEAAKRTKSPTDLGNQYNDAWAVSYEIVPTHEHTTFTPPATPDGAA